jgi:hypothetical protein
MEFRWIFVGQWCKAICGIWGETLAQKGKFDNIHGAKIIGIER